MAQTEAQKRASAKWKKKATKTASITLYPCDQDIIDFLAASGNSSRTIKNALRAYMTQSGTDALEEQNGASSAL